jgi:hypothetical protein
MKMTKQGIQLKITVSSDVTPCNVVGMFQRFEVTCCHYLHGTRFSSKNTIEDYSLLGYVVLYVDKQVSAFRRNMLPLSSWYKGRFNERK